MVSVSLRKSRLTLSSLAALSCTSRWPGTSGNLKRGVAEVGEGPRKEAEEGMADEEEEEEEKVGEEEAALLALAVECMLRVEMVRRRFRSAAIRARR